MEDIAVISALCCFIVLPFVLQAVGVFSPYWISDSTCDSHGLIYSCCTGASNDSCSNTDGGDGKTNWSFTSISFLLSIINLYSMSGRCYVGSTLSVASCHPAIRNLMLPIPVVKQVLQIGL